MIEYLASWNNYLPNIKWLSQSLDIFVNVFLRHFLSTSFSRTTQISVNIQENFFVVYRIFVIWDTCYYLKCWDVTWILMTENLLCKSIQKWLTWNWGNVWENRKLLHRKCVNIHSTCPRHPIECLCPPLTLLSVSSADCGKRSGRRTEKSEKESMHRSYCPLYVMIVYHFSHHTLCMHRFSVQCSQAFLPNTLEAACGHNIHSSSPVKLSKYLHSPCQHFQLSPWLAIWTQSEDRWNTEMTIEPLQYTVGHHCQIQAVTVRGLDKRSASDRSSA